MLIQDLIGNYGPDIIPPVRIVAQNDKGCSKCVYSTYENEDESVPADVMLQPIKRIDVYEDDAGTPFLEITYWDPDMKAFPDDPRLRDRIYEWLLSVPDPVFVKIHNAYCWDTGKPEQRIFEIGHLNEYFSGHTAQYILSHVADNFTVEDRYFWLWPEENEISSTDSFNPGLRKLLPNDISMIADHAVLSERFYCFHIRDVMPES